MGTTDDARDDESQGTGSIDEAFITPGPRRSTYTPPPQPSAAAAAAAVGADPDTIAAAAAGIPTPTLDEIFPASDESDVAPPAEDVAPPALPYGSFAPPADFAPPAPVSPPAPSTVYALDDIPLVDDIEPPYFAAPPTVDAPLDSFPPPAPPAAWPVSEPGTPFVAPVAESAPAAPLTPEPYTPEPFSPEPFSAQPYADQPFDAQPFDRQSSGATPPPPEQWTPDQWAPPAPPETSATSLSDLPGPAVSQQPFAWGTPSQPFADVPPPSFPAEPAAESAPAVETPESAEADPAYWQTPPPPPVFEAPSFAPPVFETPVYDLSVAPDTIDETADGSEPADETVNEPVNEPISEPAPEPSNDSEVQVEVQVEPEAEAEHNEPVVAAPSLSDLPAPGAAPMSFASPEEQAAFLASHAAPAGRPWIPERRSLSDDELAAALSDAAADPAARLTAMDELERQMNLREEEAKEFSDWEESMLAVGTPEAIAAVEEVRPQFDGIVPVTSSISIITPEEAAAAAAPAVQTPSADPTPFADPTSSTQQTPSAEPVEAPSAFAPPPAFAPPAAPVDPSIPTEPPPGYVSASWTPPPVAPIVYDIPVIDEADTYAQPSASEPVVVDEPATPTISFDELFSTETVGSRIPSAPVGEPVAPPQTVTPPPAEAAPEFEPVVDAWAPATDIPAPAENLDPLRDFFAPPQADSAPETPAEPAPFTWILESEPEPAPAPETSPETSPATSPAQTAGPAPELVTDPAEPVEPVNPFVTEFPFGDHVDTVAEAPPEPLLDQAPAVATPAEPDPIIEPEFSEPDFVEPESIEHGPMEPESPVRQDETALPAATETESGGFPWAPPAGVFPPPLVEPPAAPAPPTLPAQWDLTVPPADESVAPQDFPSATGTQGFPFAVAGDTALPDQSLPPRTQSIADLLSAPTDADLATPTEADVAEADVASPPTPISTPLSTPAPEVIPVTTAAANLAAGTAPKAIEPVPLPVFTPEESGPEPTPTDRRVGRAARQFWLWFAANSSILSLAFGGIIFSLGMSLRQAIIAALAGVVLSFIPLGLGTLAGKRSGQPTMIVSRATFGVQGNVVPALISLLSRVFWGAALLWVLASAVASVVIGADLGGSLSYGQLVVIGLAIAFLVALVIAFFGYAMLARFQLIVSIASTALLIGFVVLTARYIDVAQALTVGDGSVILIVTGAVLVFSFVGLVWANSSSDLARYQRPSSSGGGSMLWATFGTTLPTFLLITYGALLAASNATIAEGLVTSPLATIGGMLPAWYPIPLIAATALSLISGVVISIYSGGFALQAVGVRLKRQWSVLIVAILLFAVALLLTTLSGDLTALFRDVATTLAVPVAAWAGIFAAETMIRNQGYHAPSLLKGGGIYPAVRVVNLVSLLVITGIGYGLTTATVSWLSWQGFVFPLVGVPIDGELAASDLGVLVALLLGLLVPIVSGIRAIQRQEASPALPN